MIGRHCGAVTDARSQSGPRPEFCSKADCSNLQTAFANVSFSQLQNGVNVVFRALLSRRHYHIYDHVMNASNDSTKSRRTLKSCTECEQSPPAQLYIYQFEDPQAGDERFAARGQPRTRRGVEDVRREVLHVSLRYLVCRLPVSNAVQKPESHS